MNITLAQLAQATGGALQAMQHQALVGRVVIDSRRVEPGDIFWTVLGKNFDGADFISEAVARGACGVVTHRLRQLPASVWQLQVADGQQALWQYAKFKRQNFDKPVIGVTGSVGKTATRDAIAAVLGGQPGLVNPQNFNNQIGLPLTLTALDAAHQHAVLEMGASAPGDIQRLAELAGPQIGVITRIGDAHLGGFGSQQSIASAKAELLDALPANGWAVLNGDDPWLRRIGKRSAAPVVWVGRGPDCDIQATAVNSTNGRLSFSVDGQRFELPVWGRHHLTAALAAIAVGLILDVPLSDAARALANYRPQPMRCEVSFAAGATIVNDTYNSNPTAMQAALELLREIDSPGRRIVVCGDMAELGHDAAELHREMGRQVVQKAGADLLIACGQYAHEVAAAARTAGLPSARSLAIREVDQSVELVCNAIQPGDVVLVKGSRMMRMERVVQAIQQQARGHRAVA